MASKVNTIEDDLGLDLTSILNNIKQREVQAHQRFISESVFLRDVQPTTGMGSRDNPTFFVTPSVGFDPLRDANKPQSDLSPKTVELFHKNIAEAASAPTPAARQASADKAAKEVAKDWDSKNGNHSALKEFRQEARAQIAFAARELGLGPAESQVVGFALERAMEKEGFKVLANRAIDTVSNAYTATKGAIANTLTTKMEMSKTLDNSMKWLADHGVSKDSVKKFIGNNAGKLQVLSELAANPGVLDKAYSVIRNSDKAVDGLLMLKNDDDFRKALGTMAVSAGEGLGMAHKAAGSVMVLGGSALRGDAPTETGRHLFRAAMSIAGGAVGGLGVGGTTLGMGSVAGAAVGSYLGGMLADKLLEVYDKYTGRDATNEFKGNVEAKELADSANILAHRAADKGMAPMTAIVNRHITNMEQDNPQFASQIKSKGLEQGIDDIKPKGRDMERDRDRDMTMEMTKKQG